MIKSNHTDNKTGSLNKICSLHGSCGRKVHFETDENEMEDQSSGSWSLGGIKMPEVNSKVFVPFVSTLWIHFPVK